MVFFYTLLLFLNRLKEHLQTIRGKLAKIKRFNKRESNCDMDNLNSEKERNNIKGVRSWRFGVSFNIQHLKEKNTDRFGNSLFLSSEYAQECWCIMGRDSLDLRRCC